MGRTSLPLPPGPGQMETARELRGDVIGFFHRCFQRYGDVFRLPLFGKHIIVAVHPDDVAHIMKHRNDIYEKGGFGYNELKKVLGNGLGPTKGETWRRHRKMAQRGFTPRHIREYGEGMAMAAADYAERWAQLARTGEPVNLADEMLELNLHLSCMTLIQASFDHATLHAMSHHFVHVVHEMERRVGRVANWPLWAPTPANRKLGKTFGHIRDFLNAIVEQRRQHPAPPDDLLSHLMRGTGHPEDDANPRLLRDHVLNFFFGGHETSGYTLTWLFYLLDRHPAVDARVKAELHQVLGGRTPGVADLAQLTYCQQVVQETLRLYPIFPMLPRTNVREDTLRGYRIPRGSYINISPYVTHRHPDFWERPESFEPSRWEDEMKRHQQAFIPFGAGQTICIGRNFGLQSTMMVLAALRQRFKPRLLDASPNPYLPPGFSLQPSRPVMVRLVPETASPRATTQRTATAGCPVHA